jgi:pyridoxal phosphate enzyme (YggS family)
MSVRENIDSLRSEIPDSVKIVAVSKFHGVEQIMQAYDDGQRVFGESRVQELVGKHETLPQDIEWHFIGSLQRNKVKFIAPFISMIHSLDSFRLMKEINKQAAANDRVIPCLLQVHIAKEDTKSGFAVDELNKFLESGEWKECKNVEIRGVMGMATYTDDESVVRSEFRELKSIFDKYKESFFPDQPSFKEISMGMSGDYKIAVEEGSTIIRVGTLIFGNR